MSANYVCDLLVIGGGINGAGIAADAAGRGLSVILCEKDDLAAHTSSASSKLIHGGLRYLEHYDFKLVREALQEREVLLNKAPHLVHPLWFVLPHEPHLRPQWMIRLGLFLYDHLAKRKTLPGSRKINLRNSLEGAPLKEQFKTGFGYSDCYTDDARLVVTNALDAQNHGAKIMVRTRCTALKRGKTTWEATLLQENNAEPIHVQAKAVVNATGPWVAEFLQQQNLSTTAGVRWVKGSHFIVPKLYEGAHAYILQNKDNRIVFAIPYQQEFTLIGTTDIGYKGDLNQLGISESEIEYLLALINSYFKKSVTRSEMGWSYAGVRALFDDHSENPAAITREYHFEVDETNGLPILSVFGGKITTFRVLAEAAMQRLAPHFPNMGAAWTAKKSLPGGDLTVPFEQFYQAQCQRYAFLPAQVVWRLACAYGSRMDFVLNNAQSITDLGHHFGAGLYQREVEYLKQYEWARTVEDIIWRRTKTGLHLSQQAVQQLQDVM